MILYNLFKPAHIAKLGLFSLLLWSLAWGCVQPRQQPVDTSSQAARGMTVVLPFVDMAQVFGRNVSVRNPITSKAFVTGDIDDNAALYMTNTLYRLIGQQPHLKWSSFQNVTDPNTFGSFDLKANFMPQLQALAQHKGADSLILGFLYAFRDRSGGDYGVESPAHVAFELVLVQADTGRIIWQRTFKETQKSLSEDLLQLKNFIKRRGRWVSAQEMAKGALKEMLKTVPHLDSK